ncbi:hypothetical protein SASPL_123961 [Salvia splendens]|uniref:S-locus glycoprotein domain-containing protein n=1 Tax=Salvia splendens TaxID=180675 RepID=A0A8X8XQ36_SALSN|nr:hypothetical protein SASPL_123961 [Salvia splendens]
MGSAAEQHHHLWWCFLITLTLIPLLTASTDLITPTKPLAQNNTLVSAAAEFELGFFPGISNTWYKNIQEIVVLGWDSKTGLNRYITSWKSADDPSTGDYSFKLDIYGYPEIHLSNRDKIYYRSDAWNGLRFSGVPEMRLSSPLLSFLFVRNSHQLSYSFNLLNDSMYSRLVVKHSGALQRFIWIPSSGIWNLFWRGVFEMDRMDVCESLNWTVKQTVS